MHKRNLKDESGSVTNLHVCVSGRGRALLWINRALLLLSAYCPLEPAAQIFKTPSRRLPYINLRTSPLTCSHFHRTFLTSRSWKISPSAPLAVEPVPLEDSRSISALGKSRVSAYQPVQHSPVRKPRDPTFAGDFGDFKENQDTPIHQSDKRQSRFEDISNNPVTDPPADN